MTKHLVIFAACFLLGAAATAAVRTTRHDAYHAPPMPAVPAPAPVADPHAGHAAAPQPAAVPVNTICAICGMPVDAKLPTATYQGKTIGFGCKSCPPKFAAQPEVYGPAALQNRVVE